MVVERFFLPRGIYKITKPLTIPSNVELKGEWEGIHPKSPTLIHCYVGKNDENGEFISLSPGSGLHGLTIKYPEQKASAIVPYAWTVRAKGNFCWLEKITFINSYNGVNFYDNKCDEFLIKGVWGTALKKGIAIGGGTSNGRLEYTFLTYATFWDEIGRSYDLSQYTYENTTGYIFGNCSNISGFSVSNFGLRYGVIFEKQSDKEPNNISIIRLLADDPSAQNTVLFSGGTNISIAGLSTGNNSGKLIKTQSTFNGRVRIYCQNFWGGSTNDITSGDIKIYDENTVQTDDISHHFSFKEMSDYVLNEQKNTDSKIQAISSYNTYSSPVAIVSNLISEDANNISSLSSESIIILKDSSNNLFIVLIIIIPTIALSSFIIVFSLYIRKKGKRI